MGGGSWTNLRNIGPLSFGFLLGSFVSVLVFPSLQKLSSEICRSSKIDLKSSSAILKNADDNNYDPVIHSQPPPSKSNSVKKSKLIRPRFYATELAIKDKLCVVVLIDRENLTFASAMNKTIAHHVNRLIFFSDPDLIRENSIGKNGFNPLFLIPTSKTMDKSFRFYYSLNYVAEHFLNNYDWFYFVTDSTYVKAFKLYEFATHLSAGYDVVLGKKSKREAGEFCLLSSGILISFGAMKKISYVLPKCRGDVEASSHQQNQDPSSHFHKCLTDYADIKCSEEWNGKTYKSWDLTDGDDFDNGSPSQINVRDSNNQAVTVTNVQTPANVFRLHKYFCNMELDQINQLMSNIEEAIQNSSQAAEERITWPAGLSKTNRPKNRYETFRWDYFTQTEIFEISNDQNVKTLSGINKKDIDSAIDFAVRKIESKYSDLEFVSLLNGYKKFDPTRGIDYILDMKFCRRSNPIKTVTERVYLLRALSRAEIVPAPYVTEASRVIVVVPIFPSDAEAAARFLSDYARTCLDTDENSRLALVLFYSTIEEQSRCRNVVHEVETLKRKYARGDISPLDFYHVRSASINPTFDAIDFLIRVIGVDALYFTTTPRTEIRGDFLNRVRMNTIVNFQVFFPVPFARYHPKLVGDKPDVSKTTGRFDRRDFSIGSFYGADYAASRRVVSQASNSRMELVDLFIGTKLHIIRTTDPALIVNYGNGICDPKLDEEAYSICLVSKKEGLASKSQLAALILERGVIS